MRPVMVAAAVAVLLVSGVLRCRPVVPSWKWTQAVPDTASSSFVRALARSPRPGMSQIEIVQDFSTLPLDSRTAMRWHGNISLRRLPRHGIRRPGSGSTATTQRH